MCEELLLEDYNYILSSKSIHLDKLRNKTIFITGATGLIGKSIVQFLLYANQTMGLNTKIMALIRNVEKAHKVFGDSASKIDFVEGKIETLPDIDADIDFIIHGAGPTSSQFFVNNPVETIQIFVIGTKSVLELARKKNVESMAFLSTMEVYGYPDKGKKVTEDMIGVFSPLIARNSYPISKIQCENLCYAFAKEYGVPVKILRLTQTFGPGVEYNDGRIFAEFARCVIEQRDIVLKTKGETERCYLYTADAVSAILTVLLQGENGESYSVANPDTYCSIYNMAKEIAEEYGLQVKIEEQDITKSGYADTLYMDLDVSKLERLGWNAEISLLDMYKKMVRDIKNN